jgi:hypothetical protein
LDRRLKSGRAPPIPVAAMSDPTSQQLVVFSLGRDEATVRDHLQQLDIPVVATATGGTCGRTIRVDVALGGVTVREAGGADTDLVAGSPA